MQDPNKELSRGNMFQSKLKGGGYLSKVVGLKMLAKQF